MLTAKIQNSIQQNIVKPALKPIQFERKIVKFRKVINKIMNNPNRIENTRLTSNVATRIEKYENKQIILVFSNADTVYLKPYKKNIHN